MDNTVKLSNVTKAYLETYENILNTMMYEMSYIKVTCSISDNFIKQMIPLNVAAIKMSENVLQYTTNLEVQNMAINIINEETRSIEYMQAIQCKCCKVMNHEYEVMDYMYAFKEIAEVMFKEMDSAPISNSINLNFVNEIIPLHEGAVRMAYNALRFCICPELLPIIEAMIASYCKRIEQMKELLDALEDC